MTTFRLTSNLRIVFIAVLAFSGPLWAQPLDETEKRAVVEKAGELLKANYVFPERAEAASAKIASALAAGEYDDFTAPEAFAEKLTMDLQSITNDKHMQVSTPPSGPPPAGAAPATQTAPRVYAGFARVDRLQGNIGYIKLLNFPPGSGPFAEAANQAMLDLASTDSLIIDMRDNRGGSPDGVAYLSSFFFDPTTPVHLNSLINRTSGTLDFTTTEFRTRPVPNTYLDKPVYLLTSERTFSGGEEFVYNLQAQKRAKLFGAVTGGGANPGGVHPLNPRFRIFIPGGRAENPITKTNWEGTGVTPDVTVDEKLAFQAVMREIVAADTVKYAALNSLVEAQSEVDAFVEANLMKIRSEPFPGGEALVRDLFAGLASGKPDYAVMSASVAETIQRGLSIYQPDMSKAGEAISARFIGIGPAGTDDYELTTATSVVRFGIYAPDGKIESINFGPPQPLPATR